MKYIEKKNGYVYLVEEHDVYGRHKTVINLGKDPNDPRWTEELKSVSSNKKKKSED